MSQKNCAVCDFWFSCPEKIEKEVGNYKPTGIIPHSVDPRVGLFNTAFIRSCTENWKESHSGEKRERESMLHFT